MFPKVVHAAFNVHTALHHTFYKIALVTRSSAAITSSIRLLCVKRKVDKDVNSLKIIMQIIIVQISQI